MCHDICRFELFIVLPGPRGLSVGMVWRNLGWTSSTGPNWHCPSSVGLGLDMISVRFSPLLLFELDTYFAMYVVSS